MFFYIQKSLTLQHAVQAGANVFCGAVWFTLFEDGAAHFKKVKLFHQTKNV